MFKRDFKLFVKCLLSASVIFAVLAAVFIVAAGAVIGSADEVYTPVKVAVVDNEDSVYSRILISAVGGIDYIGDLLDVEKMDADEAEAAMQSGEYMATIILPQGFIDDVLSGTVSGGRIIVSSRLGAHSKIVEAVARYGERILGSGQYGTFSGLGLIRQHGLSGDVRSAYLDRVNVALLNEAIGANKRYFTVEVMEYWDTGMSMESYYAMCWLLLLLFLTSVFFIPLYTTDMNRSMLNRLCSVGVGRAKFLSMKLTLPFAFRLLSIVAAFVLLSSFFAAPFNVTSAVCAVITATYITVVGTAVTICFGDGITSNVIAAVGGMFFCGGIVPRQLLPRTILAIGDVTPFGVAKSLMSPALGADVSVLGIILACVYAALSLILIRRRLINVQTGKE